jgi:hypothetical protein
MQGCHYQTLSSHLLEQDGWEHLCLPAEFEGSRRTTSIGLMDPRQTCQRITLAGTVRLALATSMLSYLAVSETEIYAVDGYAASVGKSYKDGGYSGGRGRQLRRGALTFANTSNYCKWDRAICVATRREPSCRSMNRERELTKNRCLQAHCL